jgi:tetratricopeptide (TPR) repeat protein
MRTFLSVLVVLFIGPAWADDPPANKTKPPYERLLQGDDKKTAAAWEKKIADLEEADQYAEAVKVAEELAALRVRVQNPDHWEARDARNRVRTLKLVMKLPATERAQLREAAKAAGQAWNYRSKGKYADAQPLYEKALAIRRQALGEKHPDTAEDYNRLAVNLNAQGKYADAQPLYEKALAVWRQALGEDHPTTAKGYNNLADNLKAQGKYADAQPLYEKALGIWRNALGEAHPDTAAGYNNLATNLDDQGKYADAQPLYEKALAIWRNALGEAHPHTATGYNNLAFILRAQGKYADAQPLFEKALAIWRQTLGEDHPETATGYNNLAANLRAQGKYADAQPLLEKALAITRQALGDEHPYTAQDYNNLALNLSDQGRFADAQPLFEKALAIKRQARGEKHRDTARGYNNLAGNLRAQGKYADAQSLDEKALAIWRQALGEEHPDTATGYDSLAANLNAQGKYADAQPLCETALAIRRQALGEQHPGTAAGYNSLAFNLDAQGKYADAQLLYEKALAIKRQARGEQHPVTATGYHNLAFNLNAQGKHADAQTLYEKAVAIWRQALGEEHPDTALAYYNLAFNLNVQGKYADALATFDRATRSYENRRRMAARGLERSVATGLRSPYPPKAALLARLDHPREAWEALQLDLARGLLDEQAGRRDSLLQPDERNKQTALTQRLASIRPRILYLLTRPQRSKAEQKELDDLAGERRHLDADLAELAAALSQREVASLDDVRQALPADAAMIAWIDLSVQGLEEHWACVLRSTGDPAWERLPGTGPDHQWTRQDTALPGRLRFALVGDPTTAAAPATEVAAIARDLYAQRLAPLEKHLQAVKRLYVVPVRNMAGVPVEALSDRYRISYVPSGTFLARLQARPQPQGERVLALGDPRFEVDAAKPRVTPALLPPGGLLVTRVVPNGSAAAARIAPDDVLLTYAGTDLQTVDQLPKLIADKAGEKMVAVTVWRNGKTAVRNVRPGKLGVVLAKDSAPQALAAKRQTDRLLASLRGGAWKELPGTRVELARLTDLFGKDKLTILADVTATEPALEALRSADRLREFRYLHFATHGEANDVQALESRLILVQDAAAKAALPRAGQPTLDGKLTAREVLDFWKLDAELVTLSACETALGKDAGGDGLIGFAQAFLTAGSRAVCLSLWKVDDTATALLMDRFYQNLTGKRPELKGPLGKADALHEAKQWLRTLSLAEATQRLGTITNGVARGKDQPALKVMVPPVEAPADPKEAKPFAHPKYWAAFILIGDPD